MVACVGRLTGLRGNDSGPEVRRLAEGLRLFDDDEGKMNRSVRDVGGSVLAVSQFTLYGDVRRGKRPSFDVAAPPQKARPLYEFFVEQIRAAGLRCKTGRFQEAMKVELANEGPVTILLDSHKNFLNPPYWRGTELECYPQTCPPKPSRAPVLPQVAGRPPQFLSRSSQDYSLVSSASAWPSRYCCRAIPVARC